MLRKEAIARNVWVCEGKACRSLELKGRVEVQVEEKFFRDGHMGNHVSIFVPNPSEG